MQDRASLSCPGARNYSIKTARAHREGGTAPPPLIPESRLPPRLTPFALASSSQPQAFPLAGLSAAHPSRLHTLLRPPLRDTGWSPPCGSGSGSCRPWSRLLPSTPPRSLPAELLGSPPRPPGTGHGLLLCTQARALIWREEWRQYLQPLCTHHEPFYSTTRPPLPPAESGGWPPDPLYLQPCSLPRQAAPCFPFLSPFLSPSSPHPSPTPSSFSKCTKPGAGLGRKAA